MRSAMRRSSSSSSLSVVSTARDQALLSLAAHLDLRALRARPEAASANVAARQASVDVKEVLRLYEERLALQREVDAARSVRRGGAGAAAAAAAADAKASLALTEQKLASVRLRLAAAALQLPVDTHPCAPVGGEEKAVVIAEHGVPRRIFDFEPADHVSLCESLGLADFAAGAAVAGSGFVVLRGDGVRLERALVGWALDCAAAAGFDLAAPPDIARASLVAGCGFAPRDDGSGGGADSQVYSLAGGGDQCLIGTAEIPLAGLHAGALFDSPSRLPVGYAATSHCFRREAGAHGARDRGLYRLHQFTKVELFALIAPGMQPTALGALAKPDSGGDAAVAASQARILAYLQQSPPAATGGAADSAPPPPDVAADAMLARLVALQARMLGELGLAFRVLDMPTSELGAAAARKVDLEAWMPRRGGGAGAYGEVTSASHCSDYQARRLNIRVRSSGHGGGAAAAGNSFVHTLNATACAIPRVMLALLETHQQRDGSVRIPPVLVPYLGGRTELRPRANSR